MVHLHRIYTRSGDDGTTSLGDGTRVPKTHERIEAYGTVDELNAVVGMVLDHATMVTERDRLNRIQHDLFDLGADLCVPTSADGDGKSRLRIPAESVARLEAWIDDVNAGLGPLTSFVLPGGTPLSSAYHLARTVCRRAERCVLRLAEIEPERVNVHGITYLNRLSDLFFVFGRFAAASSERLWNPGSGSAP